MSINTLLISDQIIKERTSIHGNIDPKLLYPDIKYAQDIWIKPVLGTALFNKIQALINGVTPSNINDAVWSDYKDLIDTYIIDALMNFTLSKLPLTMGYQFWNKGVVRKHGENTELPTMTELVDLSNEYRSRGEYYANRLKLFLIDQSGRLGKYIEYRQPGSTIDTVTPEQRQFSSPLYLGDTDGRDNPWQNPGGFTGQPYHD